MICPIILSGIWSNSQNDVEIPPSARNCREGDCAWWDTWDSCCSVMSINKELSRICAALDYNITNYFPNGESELRED